MDSSGSSKTRQESPLRGDDRRQIDPNSRITPGKAPGGGTDRALLGQTKERLRGVFMKARCAKDARPAQEAVGKYQFAAYSVKSGSLFSAKLRRLVACFRLSLQGSLFGTSTEGNES
jgi:hypothetical protein